ncbi:TIGR04222 domain-containing membrane protein [Streptomyces sp. NPDC052225]|uniref:TIGR04222 domain-containing membrane protein n=1 Tax=Streptomyces sp. NPDC052225 TaxID=3154949 RepID=UPI00343DDC12
MGTWGVLLYAVLAAGGLPLLIAFAWQYGNADPEAAPLPVEDVLEAARLVGGHRQVTVTALAAMHAAGLIRVDASGALAAVPGAVARTRMERSVLDACATAPHGELRPLLRSVDRSSAQRRLGERLARRGLILSRRGGRWLWVSATAYGVLAVLVEMASYPLMLLVDDATDVTGSDWLPMWMLPGVMVALLVSLVVGIRASGPALTSAGRRAITAYRAEARHADATGPALAVALHGPSRIPDPVLAAMLTPRPSAPTSPTVYQPPPPPSTY